MEQTPEMSNAIPLPPPQATTNAASTMSNTLLPPPVQVDLHQLQEEVVKWKHVVSYLESKIDGLKATKTIHDAELQVCDLYLRLRRERKMYQEQIDQLAKELKEERKRSAKLAKKLEDVLGVTVEVQDYEENQS